MADSYSMELQTALQAVRLASAVCRCVQSGITTAAAKQDQSPVTVADYASQAVICKLLRDAFPDDPIIGEEGAAELRKPEGRPFLERVVSECSSAGFSTTADNVCAWIDHGSATLYSDRFWTLDPIDGTKGFLRKEQFAIALALVIRGQVELAVLGCPNLPFPGNPAPGTLAWAIRGHGAWRQALDLPQSAASRIRVSGVAAASELRVCESVESGHSAHDWSALVASTLQLHRPAVRMDSQCKYAVVAAGEADAYIRLPTRKGYQEKIWDHAAGVLLVEEAGGTVTDILGRKLDWTLGATLAVNSGVVATSGQCHPEVLMAIAQHRPAELA